MTDTPFEDNFQLGDRVVSVTTWDLATVHGFLLNGKVIVQWDNGHYSGIHLDASNDLIKVETDD